MSISRAISRIIFYCRRFHYRRVWFRVAANVVLTAVFFAPPFAGATVVRMEMSFGLTAGNINPAGNIDIELYDDQAPKTVVNFLRYAGRTFNLLAGIAGYEDSIIHRHATLVLDGIDVIQGGGFFPFSSGAGTYYYLSIASDPPLPNEYSPLHPNARGTIAMALVADQSGNPLPDSATSQWFINVSNNSATLPGYTVFGCVLDPVSGTCNGTGTGMSLVDAIANLQVCDKTDTKPEFNELPVYNYDPSCFLGTPITPDNLVFISRIPNVVATTTSSTKTTSAYAADVDIVLSNPNSGGTVDPTTSVSWLKTFTPPPGKVVQFNDEISRFTMTWTTGSASRVVTLYHGATTSVNGYYAYGPTSDNPTPHWYDFTYDGTTGAEIVGNKILLHFVDGQRGDDDLTADGSITHTGAPVLVTDIATSSPTSVGCSIAATPAQMRGNGDWILVSMFLAFVALVRRRNRLDRIAATRRSGISE